MRKVQKRISGSFFFVGFEKSDGVYLLLVGPWALGFVIGGENEKCEIRSKFYNFGFWINFKSNAGQHL
jgi:hypothetical protein